jgi:hypothetical protein
MLILIDAFWVETLYLRMLEQLPQSGNCSRRFAQSANLHTWQTLKFYMLNSRLPDSLKKMSSEMTVMTDSIEERAAAVP